MRSLALLFLLLLTGPALAIPAPKLRLPVEEENPPTLPSSFGELELAETLRNPHHRKELLDREIDVVGELTLFRRPDPKTGKILAIGFSKTHGTVMYRIWCNLRTPLTQEEFDKIANASYVTLRGKCSVHSRTKAVGDDLWYDLSVSLHDGRIVYRSGPEEKE